MIVISGKLLGSQVYEKYRRDSASGKTFQILRKIFLKTAKLMNSSVDP